MMRDNRGIALMAVLGVALMMFLSLALAVRLSINQSKLTRHHVERSWAAMPAAEAGIWWAVAQLADNARFTDPADPAGQEDLIIGREPQDMRVDVITNNCDEGCTSILARVRYTNF